MQYGDDAAVFLRAYFEFRQGFGLDLDIGELLIFRKHQLDRPAGHLGDVGDGNIESFRSRSARSESTAVVFIDESDLRCIDSETSSQSVARGVNSLTHAP